MNELRLPGIPNIHSHSFQRAMAGLAERGSEHRDSFWTWRELMYRFAGRLTPEHRRRRLRRERDETASTPNRLDHGPMGSLLGC